MSKTIQFCENKKRVPPKMIRGEFFDIEIFIFNGINGIFKLIDLNIRSAIEYDIFNDQSKTRP